MEGFEALLGLGGFLEEEETLEEEKERVGVFLLAVGVVGPTGTAGEGRFLIS